MLERAMLHSVDDGDTIVEAPADCRCLHCTVQKVLALLHPTGVPRDQIDKTISIDPDFAAKALIKIVGIFSVLLDDQDFSDFIMALHEERENARDEPLFESQLPPAGNA
ncbi:hypothetical protein [Bradyrhizobium paxllaeri]|uniref:hypothetical protein n=1 Tax=Bradyrhizobium paxllaeri TaxID=190148 RepID=UPI00081042CE|nr:hypothetical protein [Bradyrhizobium paxllaeri]